MPIDFLIGIPIIDAKSTNETMTFDELIEHYETQDAAGKALKAFDGKGVNQSSVAEWKDKGIPAPRQAQYEILTRGKLKADRVAA